MSTMPIMSRALPREQRPGLPSHTKRWHQLTAAERSWWRRWRRAADLVGPTW